MMSLPASLLRALKSYRDENKLLGGGHVISEDYSHVTRKKTLCELILLSCAVCGIEFCYAAETAFVSPTLLKIGIPVALMTFVWAVSPTLGFLMVPVLGSLSDRCKLNIGRRRPFIIVMSLGIIVGLLLVPNGKSIGILLGDNYDLYENKMTDWKIQGNNTSNINNVTRWRLQYNNTGNNTVYGYNRSTHNPWGIIITVIGVVLLDLNCDACQSPCRTYLLDVSLPEDHTTGLSTFTIMAGLGGSMGYLLGAINWEYTNVGESLGGHVRVVFTLVLIIYLICVTLTVTSVKEIPLSKLGVTKQQLQKQQKQVKSGRKYRKFVNEEMSSDEESVNVQHDGKKEEYGSITDGIQLHTIVNDCSIDVTNPILPEEVTVKTYLLSIIYMPKSMIILCVTNLFCWMSLVCYSLYFTDFVGQAVYGGDPRAPESSRSHELYESGVRWGSMGMSLYSASCSAYSMVIGKLVKTIGARRVYMYSQLVYTVGALIMAISKNSVAVIVLCPTAGIMYATLFTMPYFLVAHYHSMNTFEENTDKTEKQIRGLGTDVATVSSMVFVAQFLLSLVMGALIHSTGTTSVVMYTAAVLSACGAVSASQVVYLGM